MDKDKDKDTRRSFTVRKEDKELKFYLGMPGAEEIKKADWHYAKVYNKAMLEGISTQDEMLDKLKERGLYGDKYEQRREELARKMSETLLAMETESNPTLRHELAAAAAKLRISIFEWNQRLNGPLSNTCEQIANEAKVEYLTSMVVQKENGSHLWDSYDAFISEEDQGLALSARVQVMLWLEGLDPDFVENTPERRVMRELAQAEATPKLEAAEEDTAPVIPEVMEEEPKEKKRRGRKVA